MARPEPVFSVSYRVYYEDTDVSGVMYHARYLAFFERARTEYLRAAGYDQQQLIEELDLAFTLSDLAIRYAQPARLDDELRIGTTVTRLGPASVSFEQQMWRMADGSLLSSAQVRAGCVQCSRFKPMRMPGPLRQALAELTPRT